MFKKTYLRVVLWLDDIKDPKDYRKPCGDSLCERVIWCKSVNEAIATYSLWGSNLDDDNIRVTEIDMDHDAGDYAKDGGDFIKFLDWMEVHHPKAFTKIAWKIHSFNPVGAENMIRILRRNGVAI